MKKFLICILTCFVFGLCSCSTAEEKPQQTEQQLRCEHEWIEINCNLDIGNVTYDIYCPKCQLETNVRYKEWNRIQADMEYRNDQ